MDRGRLGVAVVLADEDDRQLPDRGQVERLVEGALVGGAVAEEADRDTAGAARLGGQRRAGRERRSRRRRSRSRRACPCRRRRCASSRPCPCSSRSPCPTARPSCRRVAALGDAVAVAAVGAGDVVASVRWRRRRPRPPPRRRRGGRSRAPGRRRSSCRPDPRRSRICTIRSYISSSRAASIGAVWVEVSTAMASSRGWRRPSGRRRRCAADRFGCCALIREIGGAATGGVEKSRSREGVEKMGAAILRRTVCRNRGARGK